MVTLCLELWSTGNTCAIRQKSVEWLLGPDGHGADGGVGVVAYYVPVSILVQSA